jgi:general stress protein CsbA
MKVFNSIAAVLFVIFAALQWNDPDPIIWIAIYLVMAVLCGLAAKSKYYPTLYIILILIFLGYAGYLFFDGNGVLSWMRDHHMESITGSMKAESPWIEETREFFGLFILIVVLTINYTKSSQRDAKKLREAFRKKRT